VYKSSAVCCFRDVVCVGVSDVPLALIQQTIAPIASSANHYLGDGIFQQSDAALHMFLEHVGFKFKSSLRRALSLLLNQRSMI
jgi:hypothetical protein